MATLPSDARLEILIEQLESRSRAPDVRTIEFDQLQDSIVVCRAVIAGRALEKDWRGRAHRYRQPDPARSYQADARMREEADELDRRADDLAAILSAVRDEGGTT